MAETGTRCVYYRYVALTLALNSICLYSWLVGCFALNIFLKLCANTDRYGTDAYFWTGILPQIGEASDWSVKVWVEIILLRIVAEQFRTIVMTHPPIWLPIANAILIISIRHHSHRKMVHSCGAILTAFYWLFLCSAMWVCSAIAIHFGRHSM